MNEDGWAFYYYAFYYFYYFIIMHFIYLTEFIHNVLLEKAALLGRGCH